MRKIKQCSFFILKSLVNSAMVTTMYKQHNEVCTISKLKLQKHPCHKGTAYEKL